MPWRRQWQPTPVFLPGEFHRQRSLTGYSLWGSRVGHDWANNTCQCPKLMYLVLFYVWKDAKVWAHWNHSFDMHLSSLGNVSCAFSSCVPSGCTIGGACSGWLLDGRHLFPPWVSSGLTIRGDGLMTATPFVYWYSSQCFSFTDPWSSFIVSTTSRQHREVEQVIQGTVIGKQKQ